MCLFLAKANEALLTFLLLSSLPGKPTVFIFKEESSMTKRAIGISHKCSLERNFQSHERNPQGALKNYAFRRADVNKDRSSPSQKAILELSPPRYYLLRSEGSAQISYLTPCQPVDGGES